jgi:eukaryotic-like serine/threonine-protein kinase
MAGGQQNLAEAKRLETTGDVEAAAKAYLANGALSDAVRVLVAATRYLDAAQIVMRHVGVTPDQVAGLRGQKRRLVHRAAMYYASAGDVATAMTIFRGIGATADVSKLEARMARSTPVPQSEPPGRLSDPGIRAAAPPSESPDRTQRSAAPQSQRGDKRSSPGADGYDLAKRLEAQGQLELARQSFVRLKRFGDAGRVAERIGDTDSAAQLYLEGGLFAEAARCRFEAGDELGALDLLVRVSPDARHYRAACRRAIQIAGSKDRLDFKLDHFVSRFVKSGIANGDELAAFYALGRLYEKHDFASSAGEVYAQVEAFDPSYGDVAARLAKFLEDQKHSQGALERIVEEDAAFVAAAGGSRARRRSLMPNLADLPELPDLPELAPRSRPAPRSGPPSPSTAPPEAGPVSAVQSSHARTTAPPVTPPPEDVSIEVKPGAIVAGRYRIERLVGEGGMAEVYEAHDQELDLRLALKLFVADAEGDSLLERFRRELMLSRDLTHENVVRVYDIGVHEERRFISMELLRGTDLRDLMDETPLTWGQSIGYLIQACRGLHAAHARGIIHRDVKPENFFVTEEGVVKVMDFGIAKKATATSNITQEGFTAGTPAYMSPEQIRDFGNVKPVSDVYAVGIIAYELFTGELPYYHEAAMSLMMMHLHDAPPPPTLLEPDLPEELESIVLDAMAKDPADRTPSCEALAARLQAVLDTMV